MSPTERKQPKVDPYYEGEPHPLPATRCWIEDNKRWVAEGCPTAEEAAARAAAGAGPPDLQALVERAGRRHADAIGEEYVEDPRKRPPHQGGYQHISPEEWAEYDKAMAAWQRRQRAGL